MSIRELAVAAPLVASLLVACGAGSSDDTGAHRGGAGGAVAGTGGLVPGTGGVFPGTGGVVAGTGGVVPGTGGTVSPGGLGGVTTAGSSGAGTGGTVTSGGTGGTAGSGGGHAGQAGAGGAASEFPVAVDGTRLVYNDGSGRRFFAAGMVDNRPSGGEQLSRYDHAEMEEQLVTHASFGCTAMRWNTFLKGIDLRWDANGHVSGMVDGAVDAIVDGLNLAQQHGIVLQITLSTGHFLQYGWQGETPENVTRVNNNQQMFSTEAGTQAYIDNALMPIINGVGTHPALLGYLLINEAHAMVDPADTTNGSWTDVFVRLIDLQRWINRVAGTIHEHQPGALVTVSAIARLMYMWEDATLIAAGGHPLGTLDWYQVQFYPDDHIEEWSPFERTADQLIAAFASGSKPVFCGEFPIEGMVAQANRDQTSPPFGLAEAYERLWNNGHSGGFTWSYNVFAGMDPADAAVVQDAYTSFAQNHP